MDSKSAAMMLGLLVKHIIEPLGPEGRLKVLNVLLQERGIEDELQAVCVETGKPTMTAEIYYDALCVLIAQANQTM